MPPGPQEGNQARTQRYDELSVCPWNASGRTGSGVRLACPRGPWYKLGAMRILVVNGPNLNTLGKREPEVYGYDTLQDILGRVEKRAEELGASISAFQSNHEGALIDFIQENGPGAAGLIVNPGAFGHYSYALRDAIAGSGLPAIEVHISNVFAREPFRHTSVLAGVCRGVVSGLGWRGYVFALESLVAALQEA
jgi:3-dehydroquinate dehydratase II